jgi:drug/metabolite transporter (DMT)-like permease
LWSSAFSVAKLAIADCPPLILLAVRFLLAGVIMLGAAALNGVSLKLRRRDLALFAVLGIANQAVYLGMGYLGLRTLSSGLSALVISANPVLTAVLAAAFLGERMTWRKAAGLLLGVGGVAFVVESRLAGGVEPPAGIAFTILALMSLVAGTILFKRFAPSGGLWVGNGVQSLSAGLGLAPFALGFGERGRHRAELAPARGARLSRPARLGVRLSALVPDARRVGCDRGELLSLPDAAARHAVRLAPAGRAGRAG